MHSVHVARSYSVQETEQSGGKRTENKHLPFPLHWKTKKHYRAVQK
jgi:hypothetical protein